MDYQDLAEDQADVPSQQASQLCSHCQNICDNWPAPHETDPEKLRFRHHYSKKALQISAENGCCLCAQFYSDRMHANMFTYQDGCWESVSNPESGTFDWEFELGTKLRIPLLRNFGGDKEPGLAFFTDAKPENFRNVNTWNYSWTICLLIPYFNFGRLPQNILNDSRPVFWNPVVTAQARHMSNPRDQSIIDGLVWAQVWLKVCSENHVRCTRASGSFSPTRLVDVRDNEPCLVHQSDLTHPVTRYASLSHCWGTVKHTVLTRDNLHQFVEKIPPTAISTTFDNAIFICQALGFGYIWIDSLCILQDDLEDWRRESALMIDVYRNSGINIAASGAEDGTVGCFFEDSVGCEIETDTMGNFLCHTRPDVQELIDTLDSMPLLQRGWVVQERIISPRNLHFAKSQVFWECESLRACQMVPYGYKLTPIDSARRSSLDIQDSGNIEANLRIWHEIVENYSRCALTKATDKLIAIAGLARLFQEQTGYNYVAGLWKEKLETQLTWYAGAFGPKPRPSSYRAPSWSWAAVDGFTNLSHNTPSHMFIEVRDLKIENATKGDAFTDILSATLSVVCRCILKCGIKISRSEEGPKGLASFPNCTLQCWGWFDAIEEYDSPPLDDRLMEDYLLPMTDDPTSIYEEISCLGDSDTSRCICLIIKPTAEVQGQYRRVGYLEFTGDLEELLVSSESRVEDSDYAEITTGEDGHEIRIISLV